ncbi:MAG: hypothetical protein ABGZ35_12750 [Planctomycetaceae bacterium]
MIDQGDNQTHTIPATSLWQITKLVCCGVVIFSVLSCVGIAVVRSNGLTQVTVTALNADAEPRDHRIPLFKRKDALPDYEIVVSLNSGGAMYLGAKPNTSAVDGLTWTLNNPVSVSEVAGVRLQDQDKVVSDAITEVQVTSDSVSTTDYRFDFRTEHSASVGIKAFFLTPIGMAISAAFFIAVLLIIAGGIAV